MMIDDFIKELSDALDGQRIRKAQNKSKLDTMKEVACKESCSVILTYQGRFDPRVKTIELNPSVKKGFQYSLSICRDGKVYYILTLGDEDFEIEGPGRDKLIDDIMSMKAPPQPSIYRWDKDEFESFLQYMIRSALVFE